MKIQVGWKQAQKSGSVGAMVSANLTPTALPLSAGSPTGTLVAIPKDISTKTTTDPLFYGSDNILVATVGPKSGIATRVAAGLANVHAWQDDVAPSYNAARHTIVKQPNIPSYTTLADATNDGFFTGLSGETANDISSSLTGSQHIKNNGGINGLTNYLELAYYGIDNTVGTGTISVVFATGAATFSVDQASSGLANGGIITFDPSTGIIATYLVSAYDGHTHCTLTKIGTDPGIVADISGYTFRSRQQESHLWKLLLNDALVGSPGHAMYVEFDLMLKSTSSTIDNNYPAPASTVTIKNKFFEAPTVSGGTGERPEFAIAYNVGTRVLPTGLAGLNSLFNLLMRGEGSTSESAAQVRPPFIHDFQNTWVRAKIKLMNRSANDGTISVLFPSMAATFSVPMDGSTAKRTIRNGDWIAIARVGTTSGSGYQSLFQVSNFDIGSPTTCTLTTDSSGGTTISGNVSNLTFSNQTDAEGMLWINDTLVVAITSRHLNVKVPGGLHGADGTIPVWCAQGDLDGTYINDAFASILLGGANTPPILSAFTQNITNLIIYRD